MLQSGLKIGVTRHFSDKNEFKTEAITEQSSYQPNMHNAVK